MSLRRASLILPCRRLDDFPTHLSGDQAAELLAASTALWHPALIAATGSLPGWHPADEPPDPSELDGELVIVPSVSRQRMASDWRDRLRATSPRNPPPVEAAASRAQTIAAALAAAEIDPNVIPAEAVADFLALGHAHLQVELLTRAMRYTPVLDTEHFTNATLAAATAAIDGNCELARGELGRAFDLLADARNHVYAVDFYVVDLTLLAASTLGEPLRSKLASGAPTSVLTTGELLEQLARDHPETLAELRPAIAAATACVVGGMYHNDVPPHQSPESLLAELHLGQETAQRLLDHTYEVFAQFKAACSPMLPQILAGMKFRGALHAAFDGGRLPKADQCKTWWGASHETSVEALAATPLDIARPETWLRLAERIGDTIAHDHVATIPLAGWPGACSEYYGDLRRAARFGPVLGKFVTLEEYFRATRQPDEWTTFFPREYPSQLGADSGPNPISSRVNRYRRDVLEVYSRLGVGLAEVAGLSKPIETFGDREAAAVINPWNFACAQFVGIDPFEIAAPAHSQSMADERAQMRVDVPACGVAMLSASAKQNDVPLTDGLTLRNECIELTVSETTGGIRSLRSHRDRSTRVSQRLVFHSGHSATLETQTVADRIEITRNDALIGEITSHGRLVNNSAEQAAQFIQTVRAVRGLPAMIVDVQLQPERMPEGDRWNSYYASRIAWGDDSLTIRHGVEWTARQTTRSRIESSEWVQIDDGIGTVTCFGLGLPFHRQIGPTWLDTLLLVAGEQRRCFQFALGIDEPYPTQTALALLTAGRPRMTHFPTMPNVPQGWFLHVAAKNVLLTHVQPLSAPLAGVRLRLLETEGRDAHTSLAAFRPFRAARTTDFRGNPTGVLSVVEDRVQFDIAAHRWIQIEAEW